MRDILPVLLETFRRDVSASIDRLCDAVKDGRPDVVAKEAHGIRGAAGSIGGQRLAAIGLELEKQGRAGDLDGSKALLPAAQNEYDALCDALLGVINDDRAIA
jgi:HPt (histidine-containing phosphotransfer) domain-containing protein